MIGETCSLCPPAWCSAAGPSAASASGPFKPLHFWFFFPGKIGKLGFHEGKGKNIWTRLHDSWNNFVRAWIIFFRTPWPLSRNILSEPSTFEAGAEGNSCCSTTTLLAALLELAVQLALPGKASSMAEAEQLWGFIDTKASSEDGTETTSFNFRFGPSVTGNKVVEDFEGSRPTPCSCKAKQFLVILGSNFAPVLKNLLFEQSSFLRYIANCSRSRSHFLKDIQHELQVRSCNFLSTQMHVLSRIQFWNLWQRSTLEVISWSGVFDTSIHAEKLSLKPTTFSQLVLCGWKHAELTCRLHSNPNAATTILKFVLLKNMFYFSKKLKTFNKDFGSSIPHLTKSPFVFLRSFGGFGVLFGKSQLVKFLIRQGST